jgi:hypothetical protein
VGIVMLDLTSVGELLGISSRSVTQYRSDSNAGRRYAEHPFPEPDGYSGRSPYWHPTRKLEILRWAQQRPGQGAGGGRPAQGLSRVG